METKITTVPLVALRGPVLFPGMTLHFDIGRKKSAKAVKKAAEKGEEVFFVAQRDITKEDPSLDDLYPVGVLGTVRQIIHLPDAGNIIRVVVDGMRRASLREITRTSPYFEASVSVLEDVYLLPRDAGDPTVYAEAAVSRLKSFFHRYCEESGNIPPDVREHAYVMGNPGELADFIASNVMFSVEAKEDVLCESDVFLRIARLCVLLARETQIVHVENEIEYKVQNQMDANQREYYLREEIKAINEELGESDDDSELLAKKIAQSGWQDEAKEKLNTELDRYRRLTPSSPDAAVIRSYIEKCLEIPVGKFTKEKKNLRTAERVLDRDHYGLKEVKKRIIEMIAALIVSPDIKGQIICLAGPPGVGKTSVARSVAAATGRNYTRISLGGVRDEAEIRGHRRTYIGAMPGRIISALIDAKSQNPLILLDEVDKLGSDIKGDPASALLEVLDSEQNFAFRDHYIDMPVDLSRVLFITTANDKYAIPDALRDRMEIIDIPGYTFEEKMHIAKRHLLPKQMKEHGITKEKIAITDKAMKLIIDGYTREAGVRLLERKIAAVCRRETVRLAEGNEEKLTVDTENVTDILGTVKFRPDDVKREDSVGLVNGLAWTAAGGEMLEVEAAVLAGTGKTELTGSLGDVMKESARAAISFIRSRTDTYGIDPDFYKNKDIHIHFPEGAVPKDGPSAGITVTTALVSALTGKKVRGDVAMTGEITLRGRVLPIGGLREKSMAAYREGIKTVYIPYANEPDLEEVDEAVKKKVSFVPVRYADEVINSVLV